MLKMRSEACRSRAGWAELPAPRLALLSPLRARSAFGAAAIVSGRLTCNVVTFFVAIAAE